MRNLPLLTIASQNYLPSARTLAYSFREHHPNSPIFLCLVDRVSHAADFSAEPFTIIPVEQLHIPGWENMALRYNIAEANTSVKAFALNYLFEVYQLDRILYLDPDIFVYRPLHELDELLNAHDIILTPHILEPAEDTGRQPTLHSLLLMGAYNTGLVAFSRSTETFRFLDWL